MINVDLHYHSGASGGVGKINLEDFYEIGPKKGINVIGTGDSLHEGWLTQLKERLTEINKDNGLFRLSNGKEVSFLLQTEVIFTCSLGKGRKSVHIILLFPSFDAINKTIKLFEKWNVKNTIGRPFVKCKDNQEVGDRLNKFLEINEYNEFIPAHIMTPSGVFGSQNPINFLEEFFSGAVDNINCVETGLSADPLILGMIPELDNIGLISNSDAHSIQLNRLGREFTTFDVKELSYYEIIDKIRRKKISRTAEFHPTEGKFFLSGHRAGKKGHGNNYCVFSPQYTPKNGRCPICGKPLTIGVLERAFQLTKAQDGNREYGYLPKKTQSFVHMVPLIEMLAVGYLKTKSIKSKKVRKLYDDIIQLIGNECELWFKNDEEIKSNLEGNIEQDVVDLILKVKNGKFHFNPLGYDGAYGTLVIGKKQQIKDLFETNIIVGATKKTTKLVQKKLNF
ncbi:MAG: endonuclease Q family protein [Candidatus Helarchaeota archaeon]